MKLRVFITLFRGAVVAWPSGSERAASRMHEVRFVIALSLLALGAPLRATAQTDAPGWCKSLNHPNVSVCGSVHPGEPALSPVRPAAQSASIKGRDSACQNGGLPIDSNGWTVFTQPTTGNIYYVSTNDGSDSNNGRSVDTPFKTIAKGVTELNNDNGKDSWLLFKKGDVFQNQNIGGSLSANGLNCAHPMVIGSYDPSQPGVVDPYGNFAISAISCSGTAATVTTATAHGWRKGRPYQLVVTKELPGSFNGEFAATITGTNTFTFQVSSCPAASDSIHGIVTTGRPVIEPSVAIAKQQSCGPFDGGASVGDYLAFVGIRCYGYTLDPKNPAFDKTQLHKSLNGIRSLSPHVWRLIEDSKFNSMWGGSLIFDPGSNWKMSDYLTLRRNVFSDSFGNYVHGSQHLTIYENYSFYDDWNPNMAAGVAVTVTNGTPGIVTWPNNPLVSGTNCSQVQFTGATLPTNINPRKTYYVVGSNGDNFSVDTSCGGSGLTLGGSPSGVIAYWEGSYNAGFSGAYPQPSIFEHSYYLQNEARGPGTWDMNLTGNIMGFTSGAACECGGTEFENIVFQSPISLSVGKAGAILANNTYRTTYNGIFELSPYYSTPKFTGSAAWGIPVSNRAGSYLVDHNLIAYQTPEAGTSYGILPTDSSSYPSATTASNNIICGVPNPFKITNGSPLIVSNITGANYIPNSATKSYQGPNQLGIPLTGGHGNGAGVLISVNGSTGQVSGVSLAYNMGGSGYKVGDVVTSDNTYIGTAGSGWSATVKAVGGVNNYIITLSLVSGGSGYIAPYDERSSGGSGSHGYFNVAVDASGAVVAAYPIQGYGYGYQVNDVLTFPSLRCASTCTGGNAASVKLASVLNTTLLTNNTYQVSDCNNLQNAISGIQYLPNSVAPPLNPNPTPPTDVIGGYFQSLEYGYQASVPTVLIGQTTGWEQGFIAAASLQQKGNWDDSLTAHAVLNWARPQFGMRNPYDYLLNRDLCHDNDNSPAFLAKVG